MRLIRCLFHQFHHIKTLSQMLSSIRKAYLNLDTRVSPLSRQGSRNVDFTNESGEVPWSSLRYLTNEERDQIDLQTRMILAKCADKVKEMEILEKSSCVTRLYRHNPFSDSFTFQNAVILSQVEQILWPVSFWPVSVLKMIPRSLQNLELYTMRA